MAFYQELVSILGEKSATIDEVAELVRQAIVAGKDDMSAESVLGDASLFAKAFSNAIRREQKQYLDGKYWYVNAYSSHKVPIQIGRHPATTCNIEGTSLDIRVIIGPLASHFTTGGDGNVHTMWLTQIAAEHGPNFYQFRMLGAPSKGISAFLRDLVERMDFDFVQLLGPERDRVLAVVGEYLRYQSNGFDMHAGLVIRDRGCRPSQSNESGPLMWNVDCCPSEFLKLIEK